MKPKSNGKKSTPTALVALRRAAKKAVELGRKTGTPAYVLENGRIVDIAKQTRKTRKNPGHA
jgi:heterodisulfide reductase subunit C